LYTVADREEHVPEEQVLNVIVGDEPENLKRVVAPSPGTVTTTVHDGVADML